MVSSQRSFPITHALSPKPTRQRVALFTGSYNHIVDGVSLTLNRLVAHLESQGAEVRVFAPTIKAPPLHHAGTLVAVPSLAAPGRAEYRLTYPVSWLKRALKVFQPTLIHIATPDMLGHQALSLAKQLKIPVVTTFHTHFASYLRYYKLSALEPLLWAGLRRFYAQCDEVYVPTVSMLETLHHHKVRGNFRVWPRGVDTNRFSPDKRSSAWRHHYGIAADEVVITFVSRLVWEKGLRLVIESIRQLEAKGIKHRSLLVGDGPAKASLEQHLKNTIFTGHLAGDELAHAYASSDIFLFPSETETFGNVVLEAMASGLVTVCADATGSRDLVKAGVTGYLLSPQDTPAFTEALTTLITQPSLRKRMSKAAHTNALSYDWNAVMEMMTDFYDDVLGTREPGMDKPFAGLLSRSA
jgi:phosphatidylinositol alpha 1,6-mannosyltransferase